MMSPNLKPTKLNVLQNLILAVIIIWFASKIDIYTDLVVSILTVHVRMIAGNTLVKTFQPREPLLQHLEELDPNRKQF